MKTIKQALLIFFCSFLFSCEDKEIEASVEKMLTGTWEWESTDGGIAFNIHQSPTTTDKNVLLIFKPKRHYSIFVNNKLVEEGSFTFTKQKCIHNHSEKPVIQLNKTINTEPGVNIPAVIKMIENLDENTLTFSDENYDGIGSSFKRINK
ncbi:hypothetical protein [Solitalea lacus]|uniref:hypothetical protein n=1 Tax=Solitalea lacus TaxID=2911172 RepID=UPI001EDB6E22|nr:hypothetical protein [Solitalea lacus]UKJ08612.1 hypothetical protein L2B55_05455 [Solitalea lacus]